MSFWPCSSTATYMLNLSGISLFSPSVALLRFLFLAGSFLMLSVAAVALAVRYAEPLSGWGRLMKKWSKAAVAGLRSRISNLRRKSDGLARWWPVYFMVIVCGSLLLVAARSKITTEWNVAVVGVEGQYRFTFQPVDEKNHLIGTCDNSPRRTCFTVDICQDYESPVGDFKNGIIIEKMPHTVENGCWSLNPDKHAGYFKRRNPDRTAMYVEGGWTTQQQSRQ